ncbi:MAG: hypothetical protein V2A69_09385 [Pseudomonadota bacterium]
MEIKKSWCGLCHLRCGILMEIEGERVVKVKGDPENPFSRGGSASAARLCWNTFTIKTGLISP